MWQPHIRKWAETEKQSSYLSLAEAMKFPSGDQVLKVENGISQVHLVTPEISFGDDSGGGFTRRGGDLLEPIFSSHMQRSQRASEDSWSNQNKNSVFSKLVGIKINTGLTICFFCYHFTIHFHQKLLLFLFFLYHKPTKIVLSFTQKDLLARLYLFTFSLWSNSLLLFCFSSAKNSSPISQSFE